MKTEGIAVKQASEHADRVLNQATTELQKASAEIAEKYKLPEGVNGLSCSEFLGRMTFIVSMSRDLKRAGVDMLAAAAIKATFKAAKQHKQPIVKTIEDPLGAPDDTPAQPGTSSDITELTLTVQAVKVLKGAGIHQIDDLAKCTDESLIAINGIAAPTIQAIHKALAEHSSK